MERRADDGMNSQISPLKRRELWESLFFLALSLALLIAFALRRDGAAVAWALSPWLFPLLIAALLFALSVAGLCRALRCGPDSAPLPLPHRALTAAVCALCALYTLALTALPFVLATPVFLSLMLLLLGERRPWLILGLSVAVTAALYLVFALSLRVRLP